MPAILRWSVLAALSMSTAGCDGDDEDAGILDGGARDGGGRDAAAQVDGAVPDGGESQPDAAVADAGPSDAGDTTPQPLGPGGRWTLVFQDEFDGSRLDYSKWRPNWFGATNASITRPINDLEVSCYDPAQVTVGGGVLSLTATAATHPDCVTKDGSPASYASGMIASNDRYELTYGFVEARMWLPPGTGTPENWAAFWVNGETWPQDGEIDIMETLGGGAATRWTYHYDSDTGPGETHAQVTASPRNLIGGAGWHVFGADWQPGRITFYYDGVDVGSILPGSLEGGAEVTGSPHYIIVNHGLNGSYPVSVPSTVRVDYVRHWQ
jgi:beta-glucanase (GH16 family)